MILTPASRLHQSTPGPYTRLCRVTLVGHNIDGTNEVMKNMNHEKPVEEVFFETCVLRMKKLPSTDNHKIFHTTTNIAAVCKC